jgi:hypothetical protein
MLCDGIKICFIELEGMLALTKMILLIWIVSSMGLEGYMGSHFCEAIVN